MNEVKPHELNYYLQAHVFTYHLHTPADLLGVVAICLISTPEEVGLQRCVADRLPEPETECN